MCGAGCSGGDGFPDKFQPEFKRQWKPENNAGCDCSGSNRSSCDSPSLAKPNSPLANFEEKYGKVITKVTFKQDEQGHSVQFVEKILCPLPTTKRPDRHGCCSVRYRVNR